MEDQDPIDEKPLFHLVHGQNVRPQMASPHCRITLSSSK
jgi:hypothetical protein